MNTKILTVSFAVFTMFFGAGNITLPLLLSQTWSQDVPSAFLGFCLTAVIVTFIGLVSGVMTKTLQEFFAPLGFTLGFIIQAILTCIEGPFGVVPRCFVVAYGSIHSLFPEVNSLTLYITFAFILFVLTLSKKGIIEIIGNYMTPLMLGLLSIIVIVVVYQNRNIPFEVNYQIHSAAFKDGIYKGYLTYDLPGAIFFTTIAMSYLKSLGQNNKNLLINGIKSSIISATILIVVYAAFFYIGYHYSVLLKDVPATHILTKIVVLSCGEILALIFVCLIFLACISTAIAAMKIWTDFVYQIFVRYNISYNTILIFSLVTSIIVSSLEFDGLMQLLTPILSILYPILLLLALYHIIFRYKHLCKN
jgi:branched-chain amino acid:cation transporter, LIVCS family